MNRRDYTLGSQNEDYNYNEFDYDFELPNLPDLPALPMSNTKRRNTVNRSEVRGTTTTRCQQLADIIGGDVITSAPVCVVQRLRNINATILGRPTRSPLALPFALSFEDNRNGRTLNLGETVILQREINPFLTELRKRGITVTAVHNHWLFENPRLMYMHWENVGDPVRFARNSIEAARQANLL